MATATEKQVSPTPRSPRRRLAAISGYCRRKGLIDRCLALLMLAPGLPLIGVLIVITRLSSSGPGIFRQRRVGKDGRVFTMYKVRTMRSDAEAKTGAVWCTTNDPRITRVGYWLRRLHLDEFPQLVNVLRGEMSLVGPRPERPEFVEVLAKQIPDYYDRLAVAPGITGLAQVNLPPDTDLDSVRRKLVLDLEYIASANLMFDIRMIMATFLRLLGFKGGRSLSIMQLHRTVELPDRDDSQEEENPFAGPQASTDGDRKSCSSPSLHDTVTDEVIDTVEMPKYLESQPSNEQPTACESSNGETHAGNGKPRSASGRLVTPDQVAAQVSKSKPR